MEPVLIPHSSRSDFAQALLGFHPNGISSTLVDFIPSAFRINFALRPPPFLAFFNLSVLSVFMCYARYDEAVHSLVNTEKGEMEIEEREKKRLGKILLSMASANANEVIRWGKEHFTEQDIRLSPNLAVAVSSMKLKAERDSLEVDIKLCDKLKAIELYFKLMGMSGDASDGALYIDYDYVGTKEKANQDE